MAGADATAIGSGAGMAAGAAFGGPMGAMIGSSAGGLLGSMFGGGPDKDALEALKRAQRAIEAIPVPTARDLQLVLEPLVQQGILTPESYSTILQQPSEFLNIDIDQTARNAELAALSQMQDIANEGGRDAQFRAAMNDAFNATNTQLQGQTGSILQNAAERGVSNSNLTTAAQLAQAFAGNANMANASVNAAAEAERRALDAISQSATLGGQIRSRDYDEAAQKAAAIDAINRYNAQNSQEQSNRNIDARNLAQAQNLDLAQQVAQYNNQVKNDQNRYNANLPQQVFQNSLAKASAMAGAAQPIASLYSQAATDKAATQGNLIGGLGQNLTNYYTNKNTMDILSKMGKSGAAAPSSGSSYGGSPTSSDAIFGNSASQQFKPQGTGLNLYDNPSQITQGLNYKPWYMADGGVVPGEAAYPGDHPGNDTVHARLSPGEVVVPRSAAASPVKLAEFIADLPQDGYPKIHPEDVRTVLSALTDMRGMWKGGRC